MGEHEEQLRIVPVATAALCFDAEVRRGALLAQVAPDPAEDRQVLGEDVNARRTSRKRPGSPTQTNPVSGVRG